MKPNNLYITIFLLAILMLANSCKKDFLSEKPSTDIVQPITLDNMVSLLENSNFQFNSPALPIVSADEYDYVDFTTWRSLINIPERNAHVWASDIYEGQAEALDWSIPFKCIFYANTALSGLEKINVTQDNIGKFKYAKGWAYFNRAYNFYLLASSYCKNYDVQTASNDLGLPLRLSPNVDVIMPRSSLQETYEQIFSDLSMARQSIGQLLPDEKKNHPSLTAIYALQSRIYLNMREYSKAELAADSCLKLYDKLMNYNNIKLPNTTPFSLSNEENIYNTCAVGSFSAGVITLANTTINIKKSLLNLYEASDLRLKTYFLSSNGGYVMNRGYYGVGLYPFTGLATDEIYLIKAECAARRGDFEGSMMILNKLLVNRFPPSSFSPKYALNSLQALDIVLVERRKELIYRGTRWQDLKRLNKEGANIILTRVLDGTTYSLLPNDPKYIFPIPPGEIAMSKITQNLR